MGDRIAIMQQGGHLAQYATPAHILMHPANQFVEDFVGSDRALKRLALQRVRDINLIAATDDHPAEPRIPLDEPLRSALSEMLAAGVERAPVVDGDGQIVGLVSIELLSQLLEAEA